MPYTQGMSNRVEVENLLGEVESLLAEAASLQTSNAPGELQLAITGWKARAGPKWGEVSARVPKLLRSLDDTPYAQEQQLRLEELRAAHLQAVRRLEWLEAESSRPQGTVGFEELRQSIYRQAESLEQRFVAQERAGFEQTDLKALDFETRLELSAFEQAVSRGPLRYLEPNESLAIKKLMGHLRDFRKGAITDLQQLLLGQLPMTARRRFQAPTFTPIPASFVQGSHPWPTDLAGKSGMFYQAYPNGQLRLLAQIKNGLVERSLYLAKDCPEGQYSTRAELESYNSNGTIEVSGVLYEGDPKPSRISFQAWAMSRLFDVGG